MKDAQKPDHVSLNTIIGRLKEGRYVIPDFQREFEWKPWDIGDLMRSVFQDYYIGSLLLWKGKPETFEAMACEPIYGHPGGNGAREHIVLDGQQRLTAMYYTFLAPDVPLPNRKNRYLYFIRVDRFIEGDDEEAFEYIWTSYGPKLLADQQSQYEQHRFPLAVVGRGGWGLPEWFQGYEQYWANRADEADESGERAAAVEARRHVSHAREFGDHVREITEQYQVAFVELDRDLAVEKVCDIFTQINSKGIQLDVFDLINALLKPKGLQLKYMWREAAGRLEFVESSKMNIYILQVMSILRQAYCSPKYLYYLLPGQPRQIREPDGTKRTEILIPDAAAFEKRWNAAVNALEKAIAALREPRDYGVVSYQYIPYASILPAFASLLAHVSELPHELKLAARKKVRHWYWASVFTNRYSGAVESTSTRDFLDVRKWIADDEAEPALIQEFKNRFRNMDLRSEIRRGTSIYNGIFNLLVISGARDWMTGDLPKHGDLDDHHIVPKSWGKKNLKGRSVDTILNRTPLTAETNRHVIADRLPNEYLPAWIAQNGGDEAKAILESHFISPSALEILLRKPFTVEDFEAFISERQRTIQNAIENLLVKERLDLPPGLRELDEEVEAVELRLRDEVDRALEGDVSLIPPHIGQHVDRRIEQAIKRSAAVDADHYAPLNGRLEFFDLRDLQQTITNKGLWPRFIERFGTKEQLDVKFGQLAELRNGIRHSRSIGEIERKEGEAALLWFEKVLV